MKINYNDKYNRIIRFSSAGVINTRQENSSLSKVKNQYLSTENLLRVAVEGVGATNEVEVQAKMLGQSTWTTLGTLKGNIGNVFDIGTWDQIRYEVTVADIVAVEGVIIASAFLNPGASVSVLCGGEGAIALERQTVSLTASTGLTVSSSDVTDIHSIQVYDSTGAQIEVCVEKTANPNERVLTSNANLTDVIVEIIGELNNES